MLSTRIAVPIAAAQPIGVRAITPSKIITYPSQLGSAPVRITASPRRRLGLLPRERARGPRSASCLHRPANRRARGIPQRPRATASMCLIALEQLPHGVSLGALGDEQVAAVYAAARLQDFGVVRVAGGEIREQRQKPRALHVGLERAGRPPADPGQPEEGPRRADPVAHGAQHLLLTCGAGTVVLAGRARVLAHARVAERPGSVQLDLTSPEGEPLPEVVEGRRADPGLVVDSYPAQGVDQLGEVLEVDLDQVVDLEPVAQEGLDGLDRERRPTER